MSKIRNRESEISNRKPRKPKFVAMTIALLIIMLAVTSTTSGAPNGTPSIDEIGKYIIIAMGDDSDIGRAYQASNIELGADRVVLSTASDSGSCPADGGYPNLVDVFGSRWNAIPSVDDAANLFEGVDFSGEVALTSDNGKSEFDNSALFATVGIQGVVTDPMQSESNSVFEDTGGISADCSGATALTLGNGALGNQTFPQLMTDLGLWKAHLSGLPTEITIDSSGSGISDIDNYNNDEASNGSGGWYTNYDSFDTNPADNVVVVDIDGEGSDFQPSDIDWVITGDGSKLIVFRLLDGANMVMSNTSILMGANYANSPLLDEFGAIFLSYQEGDSGDTVFNGDNVVLNGIAWWDLNMVGEGGGDVKTNITYNNSQGCGQFISQKVNMQNARWSRCSSSHPTAVTLDGLGANLTTSNLIWIVSALIVLVSVAVFGLRRRDNFGNIK